VINNLGLLHSWAGRMEDALASYRQALEVREGIGYRRGVVINHHNIGDVHFHNRQLARAYVAFERSRELAEEMGWARGVALNDVYLSYIAADRDGTGVEPILEATERARGLGDAEITTAGAWLAGRYLMERGQVEQARTHLQEGLELARSWELAPMAELLEGLLGVCEEEPKPAPSC
jgi:tetratricopeptide (TPR) repeat protein